MLQLMTDTENFLRLHAVVLTLGQRCADWFLLRRLLLTATLGALIARLGKSRAFLCTRPEVEADNDVGEVEQHTNPQARLSKIVERLCDSWFGRHFSTAAMRAGTVNEDNIIRQLLAGPVVVAFYDVGLLVSKKLGFIGASPDGIAWVRRPGDVRASAPSPRASPVPAPAPSPAPAIPEEGAAALAPPPTRRRPSPQDLPSHHQVACARWSR